MNNVLTITYEDILQNTNQTIKNVSTFLKLEPLDCMKKNTKKIGLPKKIDLISRDKKLNEMKKLIKSMGEKCKISIRNIRREANDELKKLLKSKDISEDDEKNHEKKVQIITDDHIKSVEEKVSLKEKEIMTI